MIDHWVFSNLEIYFQFPTEVSWTLESWDATLQGCGGNIEGVSGVLHSPNYPNPYNDESDCIYTINTNDGNQIDLTFDEF